MAQDETAGRSAFRGWTMAHPALWGTVGGVLVAAWALILSLGLVIAVAGGLVVGLFNYWSWRAPSGWLRRRELERRAAGGDS